MTVLAGTPETVLVKALEVFISEVIGKNSNVDRPDLAASFDEINDLMGMDVLDELEARFAT